MTGSEIIYTLRERLKLGSDDIDLTDEYLLQEFTNQRNFLMKQRLSKFSRPIPEEAKQVICVPVESHADIDGFCREEDNLLRSSKAIPKLLRAAGRDGLLNVRVPQVTAIHLATVPIEQFPYVNYSRFTKGMVYASLDADRYLYIKSGGDTNKLLFESVKITGLFSDPELAYDMACDAESNCDFFDAEFPIDPYIIKECIDLATQGIASSLEIPDDTINNATELPRP